MVFIELPLFQKYITFSDDDLQRLQTVLLGRPDAGDLITGSRGLRKLRFALPGRGKRGGARVIYYWHVPGAMCLLMFAYPKNEMEDLTDKQMKTLSDLARREFCDE